MIHTLLMRLRIRFGRRAQRILVFCFWLICGFSSNWLILQSPLKVVAQQPTAALVRLEQEGRSNFEAGQFADAIALWQQVAKAYAQSGEALKQAQVFSYLATAYQQLDQLNLAQTAIENSLDVLQTIPPSAAKHQVLAQVLNTQGSLQLLSGQAEVALSTWQQAAQTYAQANDPAGRVRAQINQSQALRTLGFYRRALTLIEDARQSQTQQPDSLIKVATLRSLGITLQQLGSLEESEQALHDSIALAQTLTSPADVAIAQFELANTLRLRQQSEAALAKYRQVSASQPLSLLGVQAQLNEFSLLLRMAQWDTAQALMPQLSAHLQTLPVSHAKVYALLNWVQSLTQAQEHQALKDVTWPQIAQLAAGAVQQAQQLDNPRTQSYALGMLGTVYEHAQQWSEAQKLTEQALSLAQANHASDIVYQWQWQLGRLLTAQAQHNEAKYQQAIVSYSAAVDTLQSIRNELASYHSEIRFSFQDSVEPVYRELVSLLLQPDHGPISQDHLEQARQVMEMLHVVELDNFFREACLDTQPIAIDQLDAQAAVFYPIILPDRLEVIVRLPGQPLRHFTHSISQAEFETTVDQLQKTLVIRSGRAFKKPSRQLYNWLIRPIAVDLARSQVKTLVFALDGSLRNVPIATLSDGNQYLIEQYNIAVTPGLELLPAQPLQQNKFQVLATGLTQARQGFAPLSHVSTELASIQANVPGKVLMDQDFTRENLQEETTATPYPVVHIATHGQFSSSLAETFLLAWNNRIGVNQLRALLQQRLQARPKAVELLVLSACNTATGDKRAALGLAGLAVRSGARSTVATLWSVDDQTTSDLMDQFYRELSQQKVSKAEALRQAQLSLLQDPFSQHPYYWAPYILVGNWL